MKAISLLPTGSSLTQYTHKSILRPFARDLRRFIIKDDKFHPDKNKRLKRIFLNGLFLHRERCIFRYIP